MATWDKEVNCIPNNTFVIWNDLKWSNVLQVHPSQGSVRTMTVEEGHVLNIDGSGAANAAGIKYKEGGDGRGASAVSRGAAFQVTSDGEDGLGAGGHTADDQVSVLSGGSDCSKTLANRAKRRAKLPWYRDVTCKDIKAITPTVLILFVGLLIMIFVIPYAFSSVIKQLENEVLYEQLRQDARTKLIEEARAKLEADADEAAAGNMTTMATTMTT